MGQIVTITGKSGAGRSTVLVNMAAALAKKGALVGCFSTDLRVPSLPFYFYEMDVPVEKSIGKYMTDSEPQKAFVEWKRQKNLFVASTAIEENCMAITPPDRAAMHNFISNVQRYFEVVLIEAGEIQLNMFSMLAYRLCDIQLDIVQPSIQGIRYCTANNEMMDLLRSGQKRVTCVNASAGTYGKREVEQNIGRKVDIILPYAKSAGISAQEGNPTYLDRAGNGKFKRGIDTLCAMITEHNEKTPSAPMRKTAPQAKEDRKSKKGE